MILDRKQLEEMKFPDLKRFAAEMGAAPQPSETKDMLIDRLLILAATEPPPKADEKPKEPPAKVSCTIEQVKEAVAPFILRGMKVFYDKESNCWLFRVQMKSYAVRDSNTGETRVIERWRDDSGTMSQPLATIKRCASALMQGVKMPEVEIVRPDPTVNMESVA